jgi:hypothetical protein
LGRLRLDEPFSMLLGADDFTELPMTLAQTTRLHQIVDVASGSALPRPGFPVSSVA